MVCLYISYPSTYQSSSQSFYLSIHLFIHLSLSLLLATVIWYSYFPTIFSSTLFHLSSLLYCFCFHSDYCYSYQESTGICVEVCSDTVNNTANVPADCQDYFYVSSGYVANSSYYILASSSSISYLRIAWFLFIYITNQPTNDSYRLVDGDKCDPTTGLDKRPAKVRCPPRPSNPDHLNGGGNESTGLTVGEVVGIVLLSIIFVVVVMLGLFIYLMRTSDRYEYFLPWILPSPSCLNIHLNICFFTNIYIYILE